MKVTLLVGSFLFLLCASGVDKGVFRTSPFHSLVDDLGELQSGFPEPVALQEVVARGVDYISTTGETALMSSLQTRVLGRDFHRFLDSRSKKSCTRVPSTSRSSSFSKSPAEATFE